MTWHTPKTDWDGGFVTMNDMSRIFQNCNYVCGTNLPTAMTYVTKSQWKTVIDAIAKAVKVMGLGLRAPNYDITSDNFNLCELDLQAIKDRLDLQKRNHASRSYASTANPTYTYDPAKRWVR